MAELAMHLLQQVDQDLQINPIGPLDEQAMLDPVPPPMIRGNYESSNDRCFVGPAFVSKCVQSSEGWAWVDEAKNTSRRPKWGFVSTTPKTKLVIKINTTASAGIKEYPVLIQLAYLRSYEHMGIAIVR